MKRYVITDAEWGVYLGCYLGLGFWSLLDTAGQDCACTFETEEQASSHITSWEENNTPSRYRFIEVNCTNSFYTTIEELELAGLTTKLGDMRTNRKRYQDTLYGRSAG